jgi:outer membrane protein assembly factor BamB
MQLVKFSFISIISFFLLSCFGPIKEIKYQIEDSWDNQDIKDPKPLTEIENKIPININWEVSFDGSAMKNFAISQRNNSLYYASKDGYIYSYDIINHEILWKFESKNKILSGVVAGKNNIYFVDSDGYLFSLSTEGVLEWKRYVGQIFSPPKELDNIVIVRTADGIYIASNIVDGSSIWSYKIGISPLSIRNWSDFTFSDNIIYTGGSSGKVLAINATTGVLLWETTYSQPNGVSDIERSNDTTSQPLVDDIAVYVIASKGSIAALSKYDGSIIWSRELSSFKGLIMDDDNLYVTHNSGSIYALSKKTNKVIWRNADLLGRDPSKGFIFDDKILISDYQGYIHLLNKMNGESLAQFKLSDESALYPILNPNNNKPIISFINGSTYQLSIGDVQFKDDKKISNDFSTDSSKEIINSNEKNSSILDDLIFWD